MRAVSIIGGRDAETSTAERTVLDFRGDPIGTVQDAGLDDVETAGRTVSAATASAGLAPARRAAVLRALAARVRDAQEEYTEILVAECAKPYGEARAEVARTISVLEECAEEATRITGELVPASGVAGSEDRLAFTLRMPVGPVLAITPFNGALLSPAHKVGAAVAAGAPCILKPADPTPFSAYRFMRDLLASGATAEAYALLVSEGPAVPAALVDHPAVAMVSFTGSTQVGLQIRNRLGLRPAILELGGNAPLIVHADADVSAAAAAAVPGAFGYAGQVCISVQRIYVHTSVYDEFKRRFLAGVQALTVGEPSAPGTDVGPLINEERAIELEERVRQAVHRGASLLTPLRREGAFLWPTVVEDAHADLPLVCEEAFGPLVTLHAYDDVQEAFDAANATSYGLQVGMYTSDYSLMHRAMHELDFGGVIFNDTSRYRIDRMPYGGVKASGAGKEGVRYSIEQMSTDRLVVMRPSARPVADPGPSASPQ